MGRALKLLASQQYTVSEIAGMLGYCDAKYFGKKFKDFFIMYVLRITLKVL